MTEVTCLDYTRVCRKAIGTLQRRGVCGWIERDELIGEGCLALSITDPSTEALAVTIARRAMVDAVRKNERRERGRVEVRGGCEVAGEGYTETPGDEWDVTVYGKDHLQPLNTHLNLWEAMKALPAREYQAVTLSFWGGKTLSDIAGEMGLSFQRVSQIIQSAKRNLRGALENFDPQTINRMRGKETQGAVLSGRMEAGVGH